MMAELYGVNVRTVNEYLKTIFTDSELQEDSVIRKFRITATDGKNYNTLHYMLPAIIAVGYKVNSERAMQFRKWATGIIEEFTIKAYVMDDERIKAGGSILTEQYFEEQDQRIREIRMPNASSKNTASLRPGCSRVTSTGCSSKLRRALGLIRMRTDTHGNPKKHQNQAHLERR
jgi:hypothetical protein